jgi:hypothetical protein
MEVYVKKELSFEQYNAEVTGSYAKTTATSNVPVDYSDIPPVRDQGSASSVLSYDMPNRLVSDGILKTPLWGDITLSYFLDVHSGLPYSVNNDGGIIVGRFNSYRLPYFASLNFVVSKTIKKFGDGGKWPLRLRGGMEDSLGRKNYSGINANLDSPQFGELYDLQCRRLIGGIAFGF